MPEVAAARSIEENLIKFRESDHRQRNGERNANQKSDGDVGRRAQERKGKLQRREWSDWRAVQLQLALRKRRRIESRRAARRRRSRLFQHGAERGTREE